MFDPSQPRLKDLQDLSFDEDLTARDVMNNITFEVYKVPDETYTFRIKRNDNEKLILLMFGVDEESTEIAYFKAQMIDRDPNLLKELSPTYH